MPTGYKPGSDLLIFVNGDAIGHCSTCTVSHKSESQERAVKPPAADISVGVGKWTEKNASKLSVTLQAEGFSFYNETENGYITLRALWAAAQPVQCKYAHRGEENTIFWGGNFIITDLSETSPAGDDATYSISLENSGPVTQTGVPLP